LPKGGEWTGYHAGMSLAGDRDRERASASLRRHYASGRLTVDELADRTDAVLRARSRDDLRRALHDLPRLAELPALLTEGQALARAAARGAVLAVVGAFWLLFSFLLLIAFVLTLLIHGPSVANALGFPLAWLLATYVAWRIWRKAQPHRSSR
jgi:Flp pilus assembly protein TadB